MDLLHYVYITCVVHLLLGQCAYSDEILYSCSFEDAGKCYLHVESVRPTWMIGDHMTVTGDQGPIADHTWGTNLGDYVYTESSNDVRGTSLSPELTSSEQNLPTGEGVLSFYYYLWGQNGNVLNVYINCDDVMTLLWAYGLSDGSMNTWTRGETPLICTGNFKVIFEAVHKTNNSNIAIDDIAIRGQQRESDRGVAMRTPTTIDMATDGVLNEPGTPEMPQDMISTMPSASGGVHVHNQPQETVTLSIILFLLALVFMVISVTVHCLIWRKRKKFNVKRRFKQTSIQNSGYDCPVHPSSHSNHHPGYMTDMKNLSNSDDIDLTRFTDAEKQSVKSSESGIVANGGGVSIIVPSFPRGRSKTVPNKRSFEYYETIAIGSDSDTEEEGNKEKRILSDKGDKRKKGFLGKAGHFMRSNSLPSSPGNDFYESIDHTRISHAPLAYEVTNLINDSLSNSTLVDHHSSSSSIPSIQSNHLKSPMIYDNLERRSPLLIPPVRPLTPICSNYTPASLCLNLSGSNCNISSIYNTTSSSQYDGASISSYERTPTIHMNASPTCNPQSNPFFQSAQPNDTYNILSRHHNPSTSVTDGPLSAATPPSPDVSHTPVYKTPSLRPNVTAPQQNVYHTLDPDAISDASFERSASEDSQTVYECPKNKTFKPVKSESSHDYEDLE